MRFCCFSSEGQFVQVIAQQVVVAVIIKCMGLWQRKLSEPPAVRLVQEIEAGLITDIALTRVQVDRILNKGTEGRILTVLDPQTPLPLLLALAQDPKKRVIKAFVNGMRNRSDHYGNHKFRECLPVGIVPELWPRLSKKSRYIVLAGRATALRGNGDYDFRGVVALVDLFGDFGPPCQHPLTTKVTAEDWAIYDALESSTVELDTLVAAINSQDDEVRLAAVNHVAVNEAMLTILRHDQSPLIADAAIARLNAMDKSTNPIGRTHTASKNPGQRIEAKVPELGVGKSEMALEVENGLAAIETAENEGLAIKRL